MNDFLLLSDNIVDVLFFIKESEDLLSFFPSVFIYETVWRLGNVANHDANELNYAGE